MLAQHLEESLCPGYPPGDPLCPFPLERRLDLPVTELFSMGSDLVDQPGEFEEESTMIEQFGGAVGARIGNRLYQSYIKQRVVTLTELLEAAADDLQEFTKATFADQLCPMNMADKNMLLESDACGIPVSSASSASKQSGTTSSQGITNSASSQKSGASSSFDFSIPIPLPTTSSSSSKSIPPFNFNLDDDLLNLIPLSR
jgi:hypothetical protein